MEKICRNDRRGPLYNGIWNGETEGRKSSQVDGQLEANLMMAGWEGTNLPDIYNEEGVWVVFEWKNRLLPANENLQSVAMDG